MGVGLKSLFKTPPFERGDIVYMEDRVDGSIWLMEIVNQPEESFGLNVYFLRNTWNPKAEGTVEWVGPKTFEFYNARKIA